jgi:hypothetical protein
MVFESMVNELGNPGKEAVLVTQSQYNIWRAGYLFEAIKGIRYGQSFCNQFNITDNILFYDDRTENCHRYICQNYIKR